MHAHASEFRSHPFRFSAVLKYHQFRARLGQGDLHPGGPRASLALTEWLASRGVHRVLEVGAGIGNTAVRMRERGWDVTALEPDPVLFRKLKQRIEGRARCEGLLFHANDQPYDALLAESVLSLGALRPALRQAHALIRPGGYLAFVEGIWSESVSAAQCRYWHDESERLFGIAVGSREALTWPAWARELDACGFSTERAERLPRGAAGHPPSRAAIASCLACVRAPSLLLTLARYRLRKKQMHVPGSAIESWLYLGRRI